MNDEAESEVILCEDCGKPVDTFACRVRHVNTNVGNLKREREAKGPNFGLTEQR